MKTSPLLAALVLLGACDTGYEVTEAPRQLDSFPYVDCGAVDPPVRQVCTVPLFSQERGPVTIYGIQTVDLDYPEGGIEEGGSGFIVRDVDWMSAACDDGTCLDLAAYDPESDDDTLALPVTFAPQVVGEYRAEMTIWSNDNQTSEKLPLPDDPDREWGIWRVQLRGLARPACGRVYPDFLDMGYHNAPGAEFSTSATIENCGMVTLTVASFAESGTGAEEMQITNTTEMKILPGLSDTLNVHWTVGPLVDGAVDPIEDVFTFESNDDVTLGAESITVIGNTCEGSVLDDWDADADGWTSCGGDCDDADPTANPSEVERAGNGNDDDCDGEIDEAANPAGTDDDGDGWSEIDGDCDDEDVDVSPTVLEIANSKDDDCNGEIDDGTEYYDDDQDGFSERDGDLDDSSRLVYPGAPETTDGVDNDCDGIIDEGGPQYDDDQDGYKELEADTTMNDCDDEDPWVYVGAFEFCDGYDNDCDGSADEGDTGAENGACAFIPLRRDEQVVDDKDTGCSTAGTAALGWAAIAAALGLASRRRG
jgi:hypothetical protein